MTMNPPTITNRVIQRLTVIRRLLIIVDTLVNSVYCDATVSGTIATLITNINTTVGLILVTIENITGPGKMRLAWRTLSRSSSVSTVCANTAMWTAVRFRMIKTEYKGIWVFGKRHKNVGPTNFRCAICGSTSQPWLFRRNPHRGKHRPNTSKT